jgi:hypothetical protein
MARQTADAMDCKQMIAEEDCDQSGLPSACIVHQTASQIRQELLTPDTRQNMPGTRSTQGLS